MKLNFRNLSLALLGLTLAVALVIALSGCALNSKPVPTVTDSTQGLVIEQGGNVGPLDINNLAQLVLRPSDSGGQITLRWRGSSVIVTKGQGCLWYWTSTVNNVGGSVCVKNPVALVQNEITNHNPFKIPSLVNIDTFGIPLPQMPEHRYLVGVAASNNPGSRVSEQSLTLSEIRGIIRKVQGDPESGYIYFPSPKEFPSYEIRLTYLGGDSWHWEHRDSQGIFAEGDIRDPDFANSDMIEFMLVWR